MIKIKAQSSRLKDSKPFHIIFVSCLLLVFSLSCSKSVKVDKKSQLPNQAAVKSEDNKNNSGKAKTGQVPASQQPAEEIKGENKDEILMHISGAITNLQKDTKGKEVAPTLPPDSKAALPEEVTTQAPSSQQIQQPSAPSVISETKPQDTAKKTAEESPQAIYKNHISGAITPVDIGVKKTYLAIDVDETNFREGPGLEFPIKGTANRGERFELIEATDNIYHDKPWYKVKDKNGNEVYIWGGSVRVLKGGEATIMSRADTDTLYLSNKKIAGEKQGLVSLPKEIESRSVVLNFENTDINDVIATIGELLGLDYIIEPGVAGKITIHTSGKMPAGELFPVLEQVLEINNLTVVRTGKYYRFMPMAEAKRKPLETFIGRDGSGLPSADRIIIQLVPIKFLPVESIKGVLTPLLTKSGSFLDIPNSQTLGLIDTASNVKRLLEIVDALDVNTLDRMHVRLFQIRFMKASDLSKELVNIFSTLGIKEKEQFLKFVPIQRINSVLMVGASSEIIQTAEKWIKELDKPVIEGEMGTYVYYVQNGDAGNIAGIITSLYGGKKKPAVSGVLLPQSAGEPQAIKLAETPKVVEPPKGPVTSVEILGAAEVEGEVVVISDKETNSIIIRTGPQNYPAILETIKRLDKVSVQVLIEIMVAELTLDERTQFGLEWAIKTGTGGFGVDTGSSLGGNIGKSVGQMSASGLSAFVHETDKFIGLFQAYASDSKLNVLLSPMILTSENKPATINIANEVPIETTTFLQTGTTPVTTRSFQYKSIGTKLTVTPKINEERLVTLNINQEVSQVNEAAQTAAGAPPSFFSRQLQTSVVVNDKQSLILGGLIEDKKDNSRSGIPWLYKIPVIGWLFGAKKDTTRKTELLMLITPHVITNSREAKAVTEEFQSRLESLQKTLVFNR
ncbi:MAG: type II secretion system secretin GspD [Nitrospinae bacterium]|nr:type II secretion system secretin GspD [Nitrospinota bacterium]